MRRTSVSIGILRVSILLTTALWAGTVSADVSPSYSLVNDFPNAATMNGGASPSFILAEGQQTWNAKPLSSTSFQLVLPGGTASSISSTSSSAEGGSSNSEGASSSVHTGSRGDRVGTQTNAPSSSVASSVSSLRSHSSSHSSSSQSAPSSIASSDGFHGAASTEPETVTVVRGETTNDDKFSWISGAYCPQKNVTLVTFFGATEAMCELHASAISITEAGLRYSLTFIWLLLILLSMCIGLCAHLTARTTKNSLTKTILRSIGYVTHFTALLLIVFSIAGIVHAAQTTPNTHIYNGRLLDSGGNAVTSSTSIRFSYWKSADFLSSDITGAGAIDTSATNYAGWQETHTVTPNASGYFSVTLGSTTALPDFATLPTQTLLSLYLQVDAKAAAAADTAYELLDPDADDPTLDRSGVLSAPFAKNADMIDQREIGTGSGSIPLLGTGGVLAKNVIPGGTNSGTFIIDADDTETSEIALQFGAALGKKLTYDIVNSLFTFNASVKVEGNLTVTGLINGIDLSSIAGVEDALKASSGGSLTLNVFGGSYRLSGVVTNYAGGSTTLPANSVSFVFFGSGGLTTNTTGFPEDESYIAVAEVTTSAGSITDIDDRRITSSDDRERSVVQTFTPNYEKSSYQGDGANNVGQLSISHDNISLKNFYLWTTTKTTLQDYDLLLRVPVSPDFVRWASDATTNPLRLNYRTTSANTADNALDIQVYDTNGVPVTLSGSTTNLASTSWSTTQVEFTGTPTWTAGEDMLIRVKFSAKDEYQAQLGELKLERVDLAGE